MSKPNPHAGHRSRLRERFALSPASFRDHELLELLLFYAIPQKDTNSLAHELLDRFGSIAGVMEATEDQLASVPGMGKSSAQLFPVMLSFLRRYMKEKVVVRGDHGHLPETLGAYLWPDYLGVTQEHVRVIGFNRNGRIIGDALVGEGSVSGSVVNITLLGKFISDYKPASVVLVHNHPSGAAIPSDDDYRATDKIRTFLDCCGVTLTDHLIFDNNGDYMSFGQSGMMDAKNRPAYHVVPPQKGSGSRTSLRKCDKNTNK
ncbi:MAG: RadC family protein [Clostridia bacterium]|nr:RadC family protein [Clostridia bacterium]